MIALNWVGDEIQKHIGLDDSVLDLGCGIGQAVLNTCDAYPNTSLKCGFYHGVDIFEPYLNFLNERGFSCSKWDLTDLPLPFQTNSYDHVLLLDILEHRELWEARDLVKEAKRIARKKVFVITPKFFFKNLDAVKNPYPYDDIKEDNPFQEHKCLISKVWLEKKGYEVNNKINRRLFFAIKTIPLRILHIWDVAGVSHVLAKYQRLLGHKVDVLTRKGYDRFNFNDVYGNIEIECNNPVDFYLKARSMSNDYDIIHVHSLYLMPFLIPFKKMVLEFHGTDIRGKNTFRDLILKLLFWIKPFLFSTPDLIRYNAKIQKCCYLPNPVDIDHFTLEKNHSQKDLALYVVNWYESYSRAFDIADEHGLHLILQDRLGGIKFEYENYPDYLGKFEYFIDRQDIHSLSKTALECLAMDLKVIDYNGDVIESLPITNNPFTVANRSIEIYEERLYG